MRNSYRSSRNPSRYNNERDDIEDDSDEIFAREASQEKIRQLINDLLGRWHWIALGLIVGVLAGVYYLSKAPEIYQTASTMLVKQQTSNVMGARDQGDDIDLRSNEALNTLSQRIIRPELLEKVASRPDIRQLPGLIPKPVEWLPLWASKLLKDQSPPAAGANSATVPPPPALAGMISGWTETSIRKLTRLVDIVVSHPNPEVAKAIADAIALEYQAELVAARSSGRSTSIDILVKESEQARTRLQTAQTSLANYERALLILKDLEAREIAFAELGRRYLPKHPRMVTAQADVSAFQQKFLTEFESSRNSAIDKEFWASTKSEWSDPSLDKQAQLQIARRLLVSRGNVLESEIKSQTAVFNTMLTRIQESDVNQQGDASEMELSFARLPGDPASPKKFQVMGIGTLGGLVFGTMIALIFCRIDNKLYTVAQTERETGLQVLGAIAEIPLTVLNDLVRKKKVNVASIPAARRRWNPHLVFREGISGTTFAEMFRVLRASVSLLGDEKQRKISLFSSALPGEGKTFMSSNFALAAAQQGKKTLLIDLDIRKPSVHKMFGVKRDTYPLGSAEFLAGNATLEQATCKDTGEENLHVIFAGRRPPSPSVGELLNPALLSTLLDAASEHYDQIVIDSAPLLAVPDTRLVIPLVDNFCLVVRAEYVPKKAVQRVISLLDNNDSLPSGIVFNGFSEKRRLIGQNYSYGNYQTNRYGKAYKYGYGSYGTYGSDSDDD